MFSVLYSLSISTGRFVSVGLRCAGDSKMKAVVMLYLAWCTCGLLQWSLAKSS